MTASLTISRSGEEERTRLGERKAAAGCRGSDLLDARRYRFFPLVYLADEAGHFIYAPRMPRVPSTVTRVIRA